MEQRLGFCLIGMLTVVLTCMAFVFLSSATRLERTAVLFGQGKAVGPLAKAQDGGHRIFLYSEEHTSKFYTPQFLNDTIRLANNCTWHNRFPRCQFERQYNASAPADVAIVMAGSQGWHQKLYTGLLSLTTRRPSVLGVFYTEAHKDYSGTAYDFKVSLAPGSAVKIHVGCDALRRLTRLPRYGAKMAEQAWARPNSTAGFISNCKSPFRNAFLRGLMKVVSIDQFGGCFSNVKTPPWARKTTQQWGTGKLRMLQRYKLSLAVENQAVASYVSEKLYQSMEAGTIPIYYGAEDVTAFAPPHSFINARDFNSTAALAAHVHHVLQDFGLFASYFGWGREEMEALEERWGCGTHWLCRACDEVQRLSA